MSTIEELQGLLNSIVPSNLQAIHALRDEVSTDLDLIDGFITTVVIPGLKGLAKTLAYHNCATEPSFEKYDSGPRNVRGLRILEQTEFEIPIAEYEFFIGVFQSKNGLTPYWWDNNSDGWESFTVPHEIIGESKTINTKDDLSSEILAQFVLQRFVAFAEEEIRTVLNPQDPNDLKADFGLFK